MLPKVGFESQAKLGARHVSTNHVDAHRAGIGGLVLFAFLSFLLPVFGVGMTMLGIWFFNKDALTNPAVIVPVVLLGSVLAVVGGLAFLAIVMYYLRLTTKSTALGLPDGSVRAVIAISLLFLFAIMAVTLYFDLRVYQKDPLISADVAKQLITVVATLAVSVAGFYFGTSSVAAAVRAVARVEPRLQVAEPASPQYLSTAPGSLLKNIRLVSQPGGEPLGWRVSGDENAQLTQTEPNVFRYERGPKSSDNVTLVFSLLNHPEATAVLEVRATPLPPQPPAAPVQPSADDNPPPEPGPAPATETGQTAAHQS